MKLDPNSELEWWHIEGYVEAAKTYHISTTFQETNNYFYHHVTFQANSQFLLNFYHMYNLYTVLQHNAVILEGQEHVHMSAISAIC